MKKFLLIILLIILTPAFFFYFSSKQKKEVIPGDYKVEFSNDLLSSNLYSPNNLKIKSLTSNSAEMAWDFNNMNLVTGEGVPQQYAALSGYRVYRNGQWYVDILNLNKSFLDTDLYPGKSYSYQISALTFDNKIEGQLSEKLEIVAKEGNTVSTKNNLNIKNVLIEGDSITDGHQANPGQGWADQVRVWLTRNGSENIYKYSKQGTYAHDIRDRIGAELDVTKPNLVIIGVGMNELFAGVTKITNISLREYLGNYKKIIQLCSERNITVVIVGITPAKGKSEKVKVWNSALEDLAYNTNSIFIPTDYLSETMLMDSIHPNQEAHNEVAQKIISILYNNLR